MKQRIKHFFEKKIVRYVAAFLACFLAGCGITAFLYLSDQAGDHPIPIEGGQLIDMSSFGFTIRVPESYTLADETDDSGDILLALALGDSVNQLYLYCYPNESLDSIDDYSPVSLIRYYMNSGCDQVRTRKLDGRTFITYRAAVESLTGDEYWHVYETWNPDLHLVIETEMTDDAVLPILATLSFSQQFSGS